MRFECDSCHTQYKISDDKVRGRVVRFPCRKCEHRILIDGRQVDADVTVPAGAAYGFEEVVRKSEPVSAFQHEAPTARARRPSVPPRRRPASVPPRRPATVSRKLSSAPAIATTAKEARHPGLAPPVPAAASAPIASLREAPEWHVSINDVPVGPIRREEMAHKVDAGAVSEYSLVWREGFEEWRPLAAVPELMALLHERRVAGLPARTSFSSMPPFVEPRSRSVSSSDDLTPLADSLQPEDDFGGLDEISQPPAPLGPREIFGSSPSLGSFSGLPPGPDEAVSVPPAPPEPAAATAEPAGRPSIGLLVLLVSIAVFSGVAAFLTFERYGDSLLMKWLGAGPMSPTAAPVALVDPPKASVAPAAEASALATAAAPSPGPAHKAREIGGPAAPTVEPPAQASPEPQAAGAEVDVADGPADRAEPGELEIPPPNPRGDGPAIAPAPAPRTEARRKARSEPEAAPPPSGDSLSAADEKVLHQFRSSSTAGPAEIEVKEVKSAGNDAPPLDGSGVRATVTANKPRLQRCYERAIRGQQSPPAVRLDVTVMVASSGRVKDVTAEGSAPGGLAECVAASVRRWRFPPSSEGGPAKFPIVFSAN
jgi:predicted Zn finger-like uncharacterized protein